MSDVNKQKTNAGSLDTQNILAVLQEFDVSYSDETLTLAKEIIFLREQLKELNDSNPSDA